MTVLDVNDYRPRFTERVFNTSVFENEPVGTSVITVKAVDLDEGENGAVLYRMLGTNSGNTFGKTSGVLVETNWFIKENNFIFFTFPNIRNKRTMEILCII